MGQMIALARHQGCFAAGTGLGGPREQIDHVFPALVHQGSGELGLIEPTNNTVSTTLKVGKAPHWGEPGQPLTLAVENGSGTLHNLSIPELQIDQDIPPRARAKVQVTFPSSGTVRFFCKLHAAMDMNGELRVGNAPQTKSGPGN